MKVLYDHQMFSIQKFGGITKYFTELMKNFPVEHDYTLGVLLSNNQHLKDNFKKFRKIYIPIPQKKSRIRGQLMGKTYKLNKLYSEWLISKSKYDLFHPTYYDDYFLKHIADKPYIVTVHDLTEFKYPDHFKNSFAARMTEIISRSKRLIAISENTKNDLIRILKVDPDNIDVVYHGYEKRNPKKMPNPFGRYILYVGARAGYKNFSTFLKAYKKLTDKDDELKLICVGTPFSRNELEKLDKEGLLQKILCMGVNETLLHNLYSHALAFIYPSLYEGFGMPILEAFANDCPVCLSNTSCFPEIAGEAGIYFDPMDWDEMSYAIQKVIYNEDFKKRTIIKAKERLKIFSWEKCVMETTQSYLKAIS